MSKKKLPGKGCTGHQLVQYLDHSPATRSRQSGDHVTFVYGDYQITACDNTKAVPTGTYHKVVKVIIAAGLAVFLFVPVAQFLIGGL